MLNFFKKHSLIIALLLLLCIFGVINPVFLSIGNLLNLVDQISIIGIISLGMTIVIIIAGIDLSVGSIVAFSSIVLAQILFSILAGAVIGLINGALISYGKIPAFIATLGFMSIARGAALYITGGKSLSNLPSSLSEIISYEIIGVRLPIIIFISLALIFHFFLKYTYHGKYLYAIGGNQRAAWLSGINIKKYIVFSYIICAITAAIASILLVGKLNSAQPQAGFMYELNSIAAVVIGGASLSGGKGSIIGTMLGVLIIGTLQNGFSILNIPSYFQQILIGAIIILSVLLDSKSKNQAYE